MANGTFYADASRPDDTGDGLSEANAKKTLGAVFALGTGGGNKYYIQAGTDYVLTAATVGPVDGDATDGPNVIEGYTTTPGALDGRPVITSATNSVTLFNLSGKDNQIYKHLNLTHTAATRGHGFCCPSANATGISLNDCVIDGCLDGINGDFSTNFTFVHLLLTRCEIKNSTRHGIWNDDGADVIGSWIHACANDGLKSTVGSTSSLAHIFRVTRSVLSDNDRAIHLTTTSAKKGFALSSSVVYSNTTQGILTDNGTNLVLASLINNIIFGNGGYGVNISAGKVVYGANRNNAYGSNTSGNRNNFDAGTGDVSLSGDPFTSASNFALDNTAGEGAACRSAGFPGAGLFGTGYLDIGAVQHQDAGGGGGGLKIAGVGGLAG